LRQLTVTNLQQTDEFVIITGDLDHRGEQEAYESLAPALLALERPPIC
jgi:hypothetical protein